MSRYRRTVFSEVPRDLAGGLAFQTCPWQWAIMVQKRLNVSEGMVIPS
jgi:hypothetical protein